MSQHEPMSPTPPHAGAVPVCWVGAHGGAGTTTLAALTGIGYDADRSLPGPQSAVVVCCRASATGTARAAQLLGRFATGGDPLPRLLGVAATAASPARRRPRLVRERLAAWRAWGVPVWEIAWCEDLVAAEEVGAVGRPPSVEAARADLARLLAAPVTP